jgi:hypothetical protein
MMGVLTLMKRMAQWLTNGDGTYGGITGTAQVDTSGKVLAGYGLPSALSGGRSVYTRGDCNDDNASSK